MSLVLKGQFGSRWQLQTHVISGRNAGNAVVQRRILSPSYDVFNLQIDGLTDDDKEELVDFLVDNAAKEFTLTFEAGSWNGFIKDEMVKFTQRFDCLHSCTLNFEGFKLS